MSDILQYILLVFFSKTILLTSIPINIDSSWQEIHLHKPLKAINYGATLYVDTTAMSKGENDIANLDKLYPANTINAVLTDTKGTEYNFKNGSAYTFNANNILLKLVCTKPINTKTKYTKLIIRSNTYLSKVNIYWANHGK